MPGRKQKTGDWGEEVAVRYLLSKGFQILERNYRGEYGGEIDIIAKEGNQVVFVEVKSGRTGAYGPPEERITRRKQRQLYKIAGQYIQEHPELKTDFRFDAVIVDGTRNRFEIRHYRNAFYL